MATITVAEGSDGVAHTITIYKQGSSTGENLSSYSAATMYVTSMDFKTLYLTKTLTLTTAASGILTYTTAAADTLPTVAIGERDLHLKAQIKITGTSLVELTEIFDFIIVNNISS